MERKMDIKDRTWKNDRDSEMREKDSKKREV
jgi:hypothetical protein